MTCFAQPTVVRDARSSRPSCGTHAVADPLAGRTFSVS